MAPKTSRRAHPTWSYIGSWLSDGAGTYDGCVVGPKLRMLVVAAAAVVACADAPSVDTRTVTFHSPVSCQVGASPYALLFAAGDFQPKSSSEVNGQIFLDQIGATLAAMPLGTRELGVAVTADAAGLLFWRGRADVATSGDVDVLLWPSTGGCALSQPAEPLRDRTDAAIGALDGRRVLVAGGAADSVVPASFVADLTTGVQTKLLADLLVPRARATVTAFGDGALVAGGVRPDSGELLASAEVFTGADFDGAPILLSEGRAVHGAVVLATGETLLVGGTGNRGALATLEIVDPKTRRYRTAGLTHLDTPRSRPIVLRLANGEILVAGGVDDQGSPIGSLEWLSFDAREHKQTRLLPAAASLGVAALPGGGALAVLAPTSPAPDFKNVWVISADRTADPATSIAGELKAARLFPGNAGSPVLYTGDRWLRWQPWLGEFGLMAEVASGGGPDRDALVSPDLGLAAWLSTNNGHATLSGLRFDARGAYTTDSVRGPLLANSTAFMSPDRLVSRSATPITFSPDRGLLLDTGASAFLTDATFAAFALDLTVTGPAPIVVLRDDAGVELEVGGGTCPIVVPDGTSTLHVERDGANVAVTVGADPPTPCRLHDRKDGLGRTADAATARVSIGLRGGSSGDRSSGKSLLVVRR